jgi:hypothetical protein
MNRTLAQASILLWVITAFGFWWSFHGQPDAVNMGVGVGLCAIVVSTLWIIELLN